MIQVALHVCGLAPSVALLCGVMRCRCWCVRLAGESTRYKYQDLEPMYRYSYLKRAYQTHSVVVTYFVPPLEVMFMENISL